MILEIGAAWGRSKRARIVLLMQHVTVDTVPAIMKSKKAISLNDMEQYLSELAIRVRGYHDGA